MTAIKDCEASAAALRIRPRVRPPLLAAAADDCAQADEMMKLVDLQRLAADGEAGRVFGGSAAEAKQRGETCLQGKSAGGLANNEGVSAH